MHSSRANIHDFDFRGASKTGLSFSNPQTNRVILSVERVDLEPFRTGIIKFRMSLIERSMENSIGGTIIEALLDISNAKHSPVSDLNLEIPWSLFHGSGHAIYFEFLEQDFTAHKLISWAIFPLNDHQRMRYRLQLRRVTAGPPSKLREVLQGGKHPIEKYPGYIMFSLHL